MSICEIASSVFETLTLRFSKLADRCNAACWRRNHTYTVAVKGFHETDISDVAPHPGTRLRSWNVSLECKNCEHIMSAGLSGVPCVVPFFGLAEIIGDVRATSLLYANQALIRVGLSITLPPDEEGDRLIEFSDTGFEQWCANPCFEIAEAINSLDEVEREFERVLLRFSEVDLVAYRDAFKRERNQKNWWNKALDWRTRTASW